MQKSRTVSDKSLIPATAKSSSSRIDLISVLFNAMPKKEGFSDDLAVELGFAKLEDITSKNKPKSKAITKNTFRQKRMKLAHSYEAYTKLKKRLYALQDKERKLPISLTGANIHHTTFGVGEVVSLNEAGVLVVKFGPATVQLELLTCLEKHYISFSDSKVEAAILGCFKPLLEARKMRSKYLVSIFETEKAIKAVVKALYNGVKLLIDPENKDFSTYAAKAMYLYSLYKAKKLSLASVVFGITSMIEELYKKKSAEAPAEPPAV